MPSQNQLAGSGRRCGTARHQDETPGNTGAGRHSDAGEEHAEVIHGHEMGLLDLQNRQRAQRGGDQADFLAVEQAPAGEEDEEQGQAVGQGGEVPAQDTDRIVAGLSAQLSRRADQDDRPLAPLHAVVRPGNGGVTVDIVFLVGADGRDAGVEIIRQGLRHPQLGERVSQAVFVRMEVGPFIPAQPAEAKGDPHADHQQQQDAEEQVGGFSGGIFL